MMADDRIYAEPGASELDSAGLRSLAERADNLAPRESVGAGAGASMTETGRV